MKNYTFVPSSLEIKAIASSETDVSNDLKTPESSKSIAQLLDETNEEKTSDKKEQN